MGAVFLDLDGTLTDPKPGITGAVIHALSELGLPTPHADALEWVIGPSLLDSFVKLGAPDPDQALALYRQNYTSGGMYDCTVYDGIPTALQALRDAGHDLFLMTAKPHAYARKITAHFQLNTYLKQEFGPELDGTRQDKADLLRYALDKLGGDAGQSVMIGDRSHDLNAARGNDMRFIGVDWGYGTPQELVAADRRCADPKDLPDAVKALLG